MDIEAPTRRQTRFGLLIASYRAYRCKASTCHHGAATSEWRPRIRMENLVNSTLANHNHSIVIRFIIINGLIV